MTVGGRFDVVVVGGRVAGAPTAMLLARRGLRVALVDRARLPSDTVSSHQLQVPAAAALRRWGLLDAASGDGGCVTERVRLQIGDVRMTGRLPTVDGVSCILSPRRDRLDGLLLAEAVRAGVEVHLGFSLDEVLLVDGRATGVRGRLRRGPKVTLRADLVVGADGKSSTVARHVGARVIRHRESATLAQYAYWSDLPTPHAELVHGAGRAAAAFPTDHGLTVTFAAVAADA
ncbi:NAD(P)/FAD-dependent oxidoreductase, partial [Nocardioides sp.]|uniref:NAD(P)/FAD-dependent oxidoreductase n=1 Tax=Nocardioides sp. TaxID=35761 RepID=UPI0027327364